MDDVDVKIDENAVFLLKTESFIRELLSERGDMVADTARRIAPREVVRHSSGGRRHHHASATTTRRSGAGADSIHCEVVREVGAYEARITWDIEHGYMRFPAKGTKYQRAQHFLERALQLTFGGAR